MSAFDRAVAIVLQHEGGYVNDPRDPGGETRYGISKRAYPGEDIAGLTIERAKEIYRRDYWNRVRGDELPEALAIALFDYAVNSGVSTAVWALQRVVGVPSDGIIGPKTLAAIRPLKASDCVVNLQAERMVFLARLPTFADFGRGWTRRVISVAVEALT